MPPKAASCKLFGMTVEELSGVPEDGLSCLEPARTYVVDDNPTLRLANMVKMSREFFIKTFHMCAALNPSAKNDSALLTLGWQDPRL